MKKPLPISTALELSSKPAESESEVDEVAKKFEILAVGSGVKSRIIKAPEYSCERLQNALRSSVFTKFTVVADLGYYGWKPTGEYQNLGSVTSRDITDRIQLDAKPGVALDPISLNNRCPLKFKRLPPQKNRNQFPYDPTYVSSLYVAVNHRNVDIDQVDFLFGGSTLNMLATGEIAHDCKYLAQLIPGTSTIMLVKHKLYIKNASDPGFQFERLVTGGEFDSEPEKIMIEHIQLMDIDQQFRVMLCAESDAIDKEGNPIEIKASNPRYWGTKVMFQMISNGSLTLYAGSKKWDTLVDINARTISQVIETGLVGLDVQVLENNILQGLQTLKLAMKEGNLTPGNVVQVNFKQGKWKISNYKCGHSQRNILLPPDEVVNKVLKK